MNSPCSTVTEVFASASDVRWHATGDIGLGTIWADAPPLVDALVERRPLPRPRSRLRTPR